VSGSKLITQEFYDLLRCDLRIIAIPCCKSDRLLSLGASDRNAMSTAPQVDGSHHVLQCIVVESK
jgi:hypothetical protein